MMNDCYLDFSGGGGGVFILWNVLSSLNLIFSIPLTIYVTILWFLVPLSHCCCCCCLTCTQRFPNCIELGNQFKETNYVVPKSIASHLHSTHRMLSKWSRYYFSHPPPLHFGPGSSLAAGTDRSTDRCLSKLIDKLDQPLDSFPPSQCHSLVVVVCPLLSSSSSWYVNNIICVWLCCLMKNVDFSFYL